MYPSRVCVVIHSFMTVCARQIAFHKFFHTQQFHFHLVIFTLTLLSRLCRCNLRTSVVVSRHSLGVRTSALSPFACVTTGHEPKPRIGTLCRPGQPLPHKQNTRKLVHSRRNTVIVTTIGHDHNTSTIQSNFRKSIPKEESLGTFAEAQIVLNHTSHPNCLARVDSLRTLIDFLGL